MVVTTLTKDKAVRYAKEWLDDFHDTPKSKGVFSQKAWLMEQLAARCVAESLREAEDVQKLDNRLQEARQLVESIQLNVRSQATLDRLWAAWKSEDEKEEEKAKRIEYVVWRRHDPKRAFEEGLDSEHMPEVDKNSIKADCAFYLERPWLRHPTLDWMLTDILVSTELALFGEHIKEFMLPFPKDDIGLNERYIKYRGNLAKMREFNWKDFGERLMLRAFWGAVVPIGGAIAAFHYGWEGAGETILKLYGVVIAGWLISKVVYGVLRLFGKASIVDPAAKALGLWGQMYEVWRLLEGPVINPTIVRDALLKTKALGAVWDMAIYSIIDRLIATDAAVWVIQPSRN